MKHLIALLLILAGFGSFTEAQDIAASTIPFDFVIAGKTLPAGRYLISQSANNRLGGPLLIRSADGQTTSIFNPRTEESTAQNDAVKLIFRKEGGKYFLTEIVGADDTYTVAPNVHQQRAVDPDATVSVSTP
jgi:hypothetical protein